MTDFLTQQILEATMLSSPFIRCHQIEGPIWFHATMPTVVDVAQIRHSADPQVVTQQLVILVDKHLMIAESS